MHFDEDSIEPNVLSWQLGTKNGLCMLSRRMAEQSEFSSVTGLVVL